MTSLLLLIVLAAQPSALIEGADKYPGVQFQQGERDSLLVRLAQDTANTLARRGEGLYRFDGHPGWNTKYQTIYRQLGMKSVEVSARSWRQVGSTPTSTTITGFYNDWKASSGHWKVISTPHKKYGEGIARSRRGTYFAAIIVAD